MKRLIKYGKRKSVAILLMVFLILLSGCSNGNNSYSETVVLIVDDTKIYLDEIMYHIMLAEMQGQLYASVVGDEANYWEMETEDGTPMKEAMTDMAMENAIKYELFYQLALNENYTLTADEITINKGKVTNILNNIQKEQLQAYELSEEKLLEIQNKIAIATKYYDEYVKELNVDKEAIIAQFNPDDYKQFDIEYIYATKNRKEELEFLQEKAEESKELESLMGDTDLPSGKLSFLEGVDTFGEEDNLEGMITSMEVGEISKVIETVKGFYIVKLTDNSSRSKYEAAVNKATSRALEEAFNKAYEELKAQYPITVKQKVVNLTSMSPTS